MDFLSKFGSVSNQTAALIVFLAAYISAWMTVFVMEGGFAVAVGFTGTIFLAVLVFMSLMYVLSRALRRTDVVDVAWGPAFVLAAVTAWLVSPASYVVGWNSQTLVTLLVVVWAARLSVTIGLRFASKPEDRRYVELRRRWKGSVALNTYLRIFVVQALLATLIATAMNLIHFSDEAPIGGFAVAGLLIWLTGFFFEAVGDWQLRQHLARPESKGKLMTSGLWRYTRHPNYFGEAAMWWGVFVIGFEVDYGWLGIITPVLITYLLIFVSGVPMTERAFQARPGWKAYKRRTSMFLPLPPRV